MCGSFHSPPEQSSAQDRGKMPNQSQQTSTVVWGGKREIPRALKPGFHRTGGLGEAARRNRPRRDLGWLRRQRFLRGKPASPALPGPGIQLQTSGRSETGTEAAAQQCPGRSSGSPTAPARGSALALLLCGPSADPLAFISQSRC